MSKKPDTGADDFSDEEAAQRMEKALRRALSTPPQPHTIKSREADPKAAPEPYHKAKRGK